MFDSADLDHKIDKLTYKHEVPHLRESLLNVQYDLKQHGKFPVLIVIAGVEGAGKSETVNLLSEWMDPRFIQTAAREKRSGEILRALGGVREARGPARAQEEPRRGAVDRGRWGERAVPNPPRGPNDPRRRARAPPRQPERAQTRQEPAAPSAGR